MLLYPAAGVSSGHLLAISHLCLLSHWTGLSVILAPLACFLQLTINLPILPTESSVSSNRCRSPLRILRLRPKMPELKPYRGDYYLWRYIPSTPAAGIFTALFALGTAYIAWRMFKSRAWFCTAFVIGGLRSSRPLPKYSRVVHVSDIESLQLSSSATPLGQRPETKPKSSCLMSSRAPSSSSHQPFSPRRYTWFWLA